MTQWICKNFDQVVPDDVLKVFVKMVKSDDHEIEKVKEGRFVRYEIKRLFDLRFDENQGTLF